MSPKDQLAPTNFGISAILRQTTRLYLLMVDGSISMLGAETELRNSSKHGPLFPLTQ
jgi:hypothetical protein